MVHMECANLQLTAPHMMTHEERLALIAQPFPIVRMCLAQQRWGGAHPIHTEDESEDEHE